MNIINILNIFTIYLFEDVAEMAIYVFGNSEPIKNMLNCFIAFLIGQITSYWISLRIPILLRGHIVGRNCFITIIAPL